MQKPAGIHAGGEEGFRRGLGMGLEVSEEVPIEISANAIAGVLGVNSV